MKTSPFIKYFSIVFTSIYTISLLSYFIADLFISNSPVVDGIISLFGIQTISFYLLLVSYLIGLISLKDIYGEEFLDGGNIVYTLFPVLFLQYIISIIACVPISLKEGFEYKNFFVYLFFVSPTILFILRCFFIRFVRIDEKLKKLLEKEKGF